MKIIQYEDSFPKIYHQLPEYYFHFYPNKNLLFFDIETTGFVAKNTTLYLIGVLWFEKDKPKILQWFNDDGKSEHEILCAFCAFCKNFSHIVHFNGLGFDFPYLSQKANIYNEPFTIKDSLTHIDIYKKIRSYKNILSMEHMKQVSIENYLNIQRDDIYSGKDLISIYQKYIGKPSVELERILLLHNHDDLLGMLEISQILNFTSFFENLKIDTIETNVDSEQFIISFSFPTFARLPKRISITQNSIYLNGIDQKATLYLPITKGTLKHYFKDYKNYYYLPKENMVIHKSVATYVDSNNKQKATKDTCYIGKTGNFIPCFGIHVEESFQTNLSDKTTYFELENFNTYDFSIQEEYIKNILQTFL